MVVYEEKQSGWRMMKPFANRIYLSSPTMHGEELVWMTEAYRTNWMSTVGANIDAVEQEICARVGCRHAVALSCGTSALHLAVKLAEVKPGDRVFCSDLTFAATLNPVLYEGGEPVFIDAERQTWNMDPEALEAAFRRYPDTRVVIVANLYGTPAKLDEIADVCRRHNAILIEDAAESLGATYRGVQTGVFGTYNAISFNGNKIITGSSGGMLLTDDAEAAARARKWSTQSRDPAPWYQHTELGYNYRMSNVVAGVVRGQIPYLEEHIAQKKAIYLRYRDGLSDLPVSVNPYLADRMEPNFWLSCLLIDESAMCEQTRGEESAAYSKTPGKTCPTEILEVLAAHNAEGRPIWKPMHMQPMHRDRAFVSLLEDVGADLFHRGLCLPSDNKMTADEQDRIIEMIRACFT